MFNFRLQISNTHHTLRAQCSRFKIFEGQPILNWLYTAISIKVVPEQSGKVEYERERLPGIANKFINFLAIPSGLSRSYSTFPLCSWTTLTN
jgi:hypothetical protein